MRTMPRRLHMRFVSIANNPPNRQIKAPMVSATRGQIISNYNSLQNIPFHFVIVKIRYTNLNLNFMIELWASRKHNFAHTIFDVQFGLLTPKASRGSDKN